MGSIVTKSLFQRRPNFFFVADFVDSSLSNPMTMDLVQVAVKNLQDALQKRSCCDKATQTERHDSLVEFHLFKALEYMKRGFGEYSPPTAPFPEPLTQDDDISVLSHEEDVLEKIEFDNNLEKHMSPIIEETNTKKRKARRITGAEDDQSWICEKYERTYLAHIPESGRWKMKTLLKDKGEDWDEAECSIIEKMRDAKGGKNANNVFTEREKLVELWATQHGVNYNKAIDLCKDKNNLKLFVEIKKESPGLIRSGLP